MRKYAFLILLAVTLALFINVESQIADQYVTIEMSQDIESPAIITSVIAGAPDGVKEGTIVLSVGELTALTNCSEVPDTITMYNIEYKLVCPGIDVNTFIYVPNIGYVGTV